MRVYGILIRGAKTFKIVIVIPSNPEEFLGLKTYLKHFISIKLVGMV
jgi:hypothetical protein